MKWLVVSGLALASVVLGLSGGGGPSVQEGRAIYRAMACGQCHALPGDPDNDTARRTGPVLGGNPVPRSREWHRAHFFDPRAVVPGSAMPAYRDLFLENPRTDGVRAAIARFDADDGSLDDDGIVTRAEYDARGGDDWGGLLAALDDGDEVIGPSDHAPRDGPRMHALLAFLASVESPAPSEGDPVPDRPALDPEDAIVRGRAQFRTRCAGCHGADADGNGPVAGFFGAHAPRNFRRGEYRRRSTSIGRAPADADLFRTIRHGYGPSMPGWPQLSDAQVRELVEYLKSEHPGYLTRELFVRDGSGALVTAFVREPLELPGAAFDAAPVVLPEGTVLKRGGEWVFLRDGQERPVTDGLRVVGETRTLVFLLGRAVYGWLPELRPDPRAVEEPPFPYSDESARRGAGIYARLACGKCHGEAGAGDGPSADGTRAAPGRVLRPADFTRGPAWLKTGTRPADVIRMLRTGMQGAPMPSFSDSLQGDAAWDLAHHILALAGVPAERGLR